MKIVFQTLPVAARGLLPDGTRAPGFLSFQAKVYDTQEEFRSVWPNASLPTTVAKWRSHANPSGHIVVPPASRHHPDVPPVTIPATVLNGVPAEALIAMEWWWSPQQ